MSCLLQVFSLKAFTQHRIVSGAVPKVSDMHSVFTSSSFKIDVLRRTEMLISHFGAMISFTRRMSCL